MTRTISSYTDSSKHYFLTISTSGQAIGCTCKARHFSCGKPCKHMSGFNADVERAAAFLALQARFDVRSQAVREQKRANYWNFEMSLGL